jgi:hypothetical protein
MVASTSSNASDCILVTGDDLRTDAAVGVVGRMGLALVGARATATTHASIAERDEIEAGLNRRVATRPAASPAS